MPWLLLASGAKRAGSAILTWLSHRSFWQLVSMGLCGLLLIQHFQLLDARHDAAKWQRLYARIHTQIDEADKAVRKAQAELAKVSQQLRKQSDEENRRIAGDANALRVSGPGKAVCRPVASPSGEHGSTGGKPDAPGSQVPPAVSAAVPWNWLINRAEEHDIDRTEVLAWREWYRKLVENWPRGPDGNSKS